MTDPQTPDPADRTSPEAPGGRLHAQVWSAITGRGLGYRLAEAVGMVPLVAPLIAAGYYQADLAHAVFGWAHPWAYVFPLAIEGGAAYAATLYHRKLVAGDSTIGARIGMLTYAAASSALLYWHARDTGRPWQAAAAIAAMTLAAVWIWTQRARWHRRDELRRRGLIDTQAPRFSVLRWLLCPVETPRAYRWAIKHGHSDPQSALTAYRARRAERPAADSPRPVRAPRVDRDRVADPEPVRSAPSRTPNGHDNARPLRSADDTQALAALRKAYPGRTPSLDETQTLLARLSPNGKCGRSRAVRLRGLLDTTDPEEDVALIQTPSPYPTPREVTA